MAAQSNLADRALAAGAAHRARPLGIAGTPSAPVVDRCYRGSGRAGVATDCIWTAAGRATVCCMEGKKRSEGTAGLVRVVMVGSDHVIGLLPRPL